MQIFEWPSKGRVAHIKSSRLARPGASSAWNILGVLMAFAGGGHPSRVAGGRVPPLLVSERRLIFWTKAARAVYHFAGICPCWVGPVDLAKALSPLGLKGSMKGFEYRRPSAPQAAPTLSRRGIRYRFRLLHACSGHARDAKPSSRSNLKPQAKRLDRRCSRPRIPSHMKRPQGEPQVSSGNSGDTERPSRLGTSTTGACHCAPRVFTPHLVTANTEGRA